MSDPLPPTPEPTGKYLSEKPDGESLDNRSTTGLISVGGVASAPGPRSVGDFELLEEIAHGGMGIVYKARDRKLNRIVAIKMILTARLASPEAIRRFHTEAEAAARLDHPGIVPVYEVGEQDGRHYLVMAYLDGGSLATRLKDGPLSPRDAADLGRRIAEAVAFAHGKGIIHRDLKPGNVLLQLDDSGRESGTSVATGKSDRMATKSAGMPVPRIVDFGLAKLVQVDSDLTETGQVLGTPAYMPPEQASGRVAEVGPAADIYALGAMLYCMLTGRPPFQAATPVDTLRQVLEREPVSPRLLNPAVPRDLETICMKCLHKEPGRRYATAVELGDDLQRFLDSRPIVARPAGQIERGVKWVWRNPLAAGLIVALSLGSIGSTAGAVVALRQRDRAVVAERQRTIEEKRRVETQRQRLIDTHLAAADLALQRGAWRDVLDAYEHAEADGLTLTVPMRVQRVRALFAMSQMTRVERELKDLRMRHDLGDHAALVDLYRGDLALGIDNAEAEQLLQSALSGKLADSDAWYARGLLARRSDEALRCFRKAVEADRFHREARGFVGMLLPLLGRHDEALRWLEQCELLFPDDPQFQLLFGMCHDLRGDPKSADGRWQRIDKVFPTETMKLVRTMLSMVPKLGPLMEQSAGVSDSADTGQLLQAALAYNQLRAVAGRIQQISRPLQSDEDAIVQAPVLRVPFSLEPLHQFLNHLAEIFEAERRGKDLLDEIVRDEKRFAEIVRLIDAVGEGMARHYHGLMLLSKALNYAAGPDRNDAKFFAAMQETAAVYERARHEPGLVDARRCAAHGYIMALTHLGAPQRPGHDPAMQALAAREIRELMRQGPIPSSVREIYLKSARNAKDWNLARDILDQWERRSPTDFVAVQWRARIELDAQAFASAVIAAKRWHERDPGHPEAKRVLTESLARLKQQTADLARAD